MDFRRKPSSFQPEMGSACLEKEIHVWTVDLGFPPVPVEKLAVYLDADEHKRKGNFKLERHRLDHVVCRGMLKVLLGAYLGLPPSAVVLARGAGGKPVLADRPGKGIHFNLAHSHGLAVYAFSKDVPLGIDVEAVREDVDAQGIAGLFFTPREASRLEACPEKDRQEMFFAMWTAKEAYVKALGGGLGMISLSSFEVEPTPEGLAVRGEKGMTLVPLEIQEGFAACLASCSDGMPPVRIFSATAFANSAA